MKMSLPKAKQKLQPSIAVAREKERAATLGRGEIPDDLGLMEGTFIMPFGKNLPSWSKEFKKRWRLEKYRARVKLSEAIAALMYNFWSVRPRPKLHYTTAAATGKKMHKEMYEAFAAGKLKSVEGEICTGLLSSLRGRIAQRAPNTHLRWTLHKYLSEPRVVSYRAGLMPNFDGSANKDKTAQNGLLQATIRIHSLQSLQHVRTRTVRERGKLVPKEMLVDSAGREISGEQVDAEAQARRNAKETVEYFVIQRQLKRSKEGPWMVWGTAEETAVESVEKKVRRRKEEKALRKAGKAAAAES